MAALLDEFVAELRQLTGCSAVGIRILDEKGHIPFQACDGFSREFQELEKSFQNDSHRCLCMDFVQGVIRNDETPSRLKHVTSGGSFHLNGTTRFLAEASEKWKCRIRSFCQEFGYESIALIPILQDRRKLGLIHVADPGKDRLPVEMVELLEAAAIQLGTAIQRVWAEDALRKSEFRYRDLLNQLKDFVWRIDSQGRFTFVSPAAKSMFGYEVEELNGASITKVLAENSIPAAMKSLDRRRRGELPEEGVTIELTHRRKNGTEFVGESRTTPIYGPEGELLELGGITRDISDRKRVEDALRKSRWELFIRNRISEVFLSVLDENVYAEVLEVVLEVSESKYGLFGYIDEDGSLVCPSLTREIWSRCQIPDKSIIFPREKWGGIWGRALREKKSFVLNEGLRVPGGHISLSRALCTPIVHRDRVLGLIAIADKKTDYGKQDRDLLETMACQIAPILHARLQGEQQYRARKSAEDALITLQEQLESGHSFSGIVGCNEKMQELFETIREVSEVDVPVFIHGESGTGKELVANAIHKEGPRAGKPFIPVNCSALPENLLESELFGHVKGAFSGAIRDKKGRFELADGGTIFLDEVGDLSPPIQVSLLRVLQEGTLERVGGEKTIKVNVRVISATNRDLGQLVQSGKFREDLFYRLCVIPVNVPPLRERRNDISLLAHHILNQVLKNSDRKMVQISREVLDALNRHDWPGNVRELQNAIHFATVKCKGEVLQLDHFPPAIAAAANKSSENGSRRGRKQKILDMDSVQRKLEETGGNKMEAAKRLGISRATLYKYLEQDGTSD